MKTNAQFFRRTDRINRIGVMIYDGWIWSWQIVGDPDANMTESTVNRVALTKERQEEILEKCKPCEERDVKSLATEHSNLALIAIKKISDAKPEP